MVLGWVETYVDDIFGGKTFGATWGQYLGERHPSEISTTFFFCIFSIFFRKVAEVLVCLWSQMAHQMTCVTSEHPKKNFWANISLVSVMRFLDFFFWKKLFRVQDCVLDRYGLAWNIFWDKTFKQTQNSIFQILQNKKQKSHFSKKKFNI